jgi:hypothetical protein
MSMICCLRQATDDAISKLLENPKRIREFISSGENETSPDVSSGVLKNLITSCTSSSRFSSS